MGVPKRKLTQSRRDKRRTHHNLTAVNISLCSRCQEPKLPHRICLECGYYHGKQIINREGE